MKSARRLLAILAVLLLILSAGFLAGAPDSDLSLSSRSYGRNGTSGLAALLAGSGREVASEPSRFGSARADEAVIAFLDPQLAPSMPAALLRLAREGRTVIAAWSVPGRTPPTTPLRAEWATGGGWTITALPSESPEALEPPALSPSIAAARLEKGPLVLAEKAGRGRLIEVVSGVSASNLVLGKHENAAFWLDLVNRFAPGQPVRFMDAWSGSRRMETVFSVFGRPGEALGWQILLILAIAAAAAFVRFGPALPPRIQAYGARQLFDAFGEMTRRQRRHRLALTLIAADAEHRLRRAASVPPGAARSALIKRLPLEHAQAIQDAWQAPDKVSSEEARRISRKLLDSVESLERSSKARRSAG